ncbi:hypothetical protein DFH29DRAFT_1008888 [Suillus ampliporus]|nr:hypothetical protein DFH29DRAFT_1008888 [Suillus ampliporus]
MDFHYLVQSPQINDDDLTRILAALDEFHVNKDAIIAAGLATSLIDEKQKVTLTGTEYSSDDEDDAVIADTNVNDDIPTEFLSSIQHGHPCPITDYFAITLQPALANFLHCEASCRHDHVHVVGGPRRAGPNATLPFEKVQVWFKLHLQSKGYHDEVQDVRPAQTLNCVPPSEPWTCGRYDTVIVNTNVGFSWPSSGLLGHTIAQVRLVICPLGKTGMQWPWLDRFLTYVHHFDIIPQGTNGCDPATQMHLLKRVKRSCGTWMGDVVSVSQLQAPVNIVAHFGAAANDCLTAYNSLEHASEFWLNQFWDKSTYFPLSL